MPTIAKKAGIASRSSPPSSQSRWAAVRRAHQSHSTVMIPNTATKYSPDHFTEQAMPRSRPATSRHGRTPAEIPSRGGASPLVCSLALASASRSRKRSRSMSRAPKAARAKTMTKGSSRLVREWTSDSPSIASSSPAISPAVVERNRRRPILASSSTATAPSTAEEIRQPHGFSGPSSSMPAPITHLPSGGWTTYEPSAS